MSAGHHERSHKRFRVSFNRVFIADSIATELVWEHPYYPWAYIPSRDVQTQYLSDSKTASNFTLPSVIPGKAKTSLLEVNGKATDKVTWILDGPLKDYIRFDFDAMDAWYEEDQEIYVHPKDPYKRIDVLPSTRHIVVKIDGTLVAESSAPTLLFETSLPVRYYLPKTALKWEYLVESKTTSKCPYKGEANYYSVIINGKEYPDIIWWYRYPTYESIAITGLACFYNEKVDIWVDGVLQERAKTKFS